MNESTVIPEQEETGLSKSLKIIAYPVSALTGFLFAKPLIRDAAYDNLKDYGAFRDSQPQHVEELKQIVERFHQHQPVNILADTRKAHEAYGARVTERLNEMGLGSLTEQWRFIHKTQQQNALMTGFTAGAISLGALLTVANSKTFARALAKKDETAEERKP